MVRPLKQKNALMWFRLSVRGDKSDKSRSLRHYTTVIKYDLRF